MRPSAEDILKDGNHEIRKLLAERSPDIIIPMMIQYKHRMEELRARFDALGETERNDPKNEETRLLLLEIQIYHGLLIYSNYLQLKFQKSPPQTMIDSWLKNLEYYWQGLRYDNKFFDWEKLAYHKLLVFQLSLKTVCMITLVESSTAILFDNILHLLCEIQSYQNCALPIYKKKDKKTQASAEEILALFHDKVGGVHEISTWNSAVLLALAQAKSSFILRSDSSPSDKHFIDSALMSLKANVPKKDSPPPIPEEIKDFDLKEFRKKFLIKLGESLFLGSDSIQGFLLSEKKIFGKALFLKLQIEYSSIEDEEMEQTAFPHEDQMHQWCFYRGFFQDIFPLLYLAHYFSGSTNLGFLAIEKPLLNAELEKNSTESDQISGVLRRICLLDEADQDLLRQMDGLVVKDLQKIFHYYLAEKSKNSELYVQRARSLLHGFDPISFDALATVFEVQDKSKIIEEIKKYFKKMSRHILDWKNFLSVMSFFLIIKKITPLESTELVTFAREAFEELKKSIVEKGLSQSRLIKQQGLDCELRELMEAQTVSHIAYLQKQYNFRKEELNIAIKTAQEGTEERLLLGMEILSLTCIHLYSQYRLIVLERNQNQEAFYARLDEVEAALKPDERNSPELRIFYYKMKLFLLSIKLCSQRLTPGLIAKITDYFLHFTLEMQNYKDTSLLIARQAAVKKDLNPFLSELIGESQALFKKADDDYRDFWSQCTVKSVRMAHQYLKATKEVHSNPGIVFINNIYNLELRCFQNIFKKPLPKFPLNFSREVAVDIYNAFGSYDKAKVLEYEKIGFIFAELLFRQSNFFWLYCENSETTNPNEMRAVLESIHHCLVEYLPWLILWNHFFPSAILRFLSSPRVLELEKIFEIGPGQKKDILKNPLDLFAAISKKFNNVEKIKNFLRTAKDRKLLFQDSIEFSDAAHLLLACQSVLKMQNPELTQLIKSIFEPPIDDVLQNIMKSKGNKAKNSPKKSPMKTSASAKTKIPVKKVDAEKTEDTKVSVPREEQVLAKEPVQTQESVQMQETMQAKELAQTNGSVISEEESPGKSKNNSVVKKKKKKKGKNQIGKESKRSFTGVTEKIFGSENTTVEVYQEISAPETAAASPAEVLDLEPTCIVEVSAGISAVAPATSVEVLGLEPTSMVKEAFTLLDFLLDLKERGLVVEREIKPKCYPVHQLIEVFNENALEEDNFEFATFLTGGAILSYFLGYQVTIHDYDLRCKAEPEELKQMLSSIKHNNSALGILGISGRSLETNHPLLIPEFEKYPGLIVETTPRKGARDLMLLDFMTRTQDEGDFVPNSLLFTQCGGREFLFDSQGAFKALNPFCGTILRLQIEVDAENKAYYDFWRSLDSSLDALAPNTAVLNLFWRSLDRTRFEHPPENKVLLILRAIKFLVKYPDFLPTTELLTWFRENRECFLKEESFLPSFHAFIKLIYSGVMCLSLLKIKACNLMDLLMILCPPVFRLMSLPAGEFYFHQRTRYFDVQISPGCRERESKEYFRVLGEALTWFLLPLQNKVNLAAVPEQIEKIKRKEVRSWAEFWQPIDQVQQGPAVQNLPQLN